MSIICRKEKWLKTNMLSFYGELVADNKCRRLVGNHVGDIKNGEKDLAVMQKAGILRHEGKVNVGVWVIFEKKI